MKQHRKEKTRKRAREEIQYLFRLAEKASLPLANRYVEMARELSLRTKTPIPPDLRRRLCKSCHHMLTISKMTVRTKNGNVITTCPDCGHVMRYGYRREQKTLQKTRQKRNAIKTSQ
jgi:ribonuclease P protein subunit RPR2